MGLGVEVRVHGDLNDFLPPARRGRRIAVDVAAGTTVKDLVESLGVPHTEVDVIVVNGQSVDFAHQVADGARVDVFPLLAAVNLAPVVHLHPPPLGRPTFVLDVHLGRLARYLRLLGFDVWWRNDTSDDELVRVCRSEDRVLLTRDRGLLKRAAVTRGSFVRETAWRRQLVEVLRRFELFGAIEPFGRCLECNGRLAHVTKAEVEKRLPPRTRRDYHDFRRCPDCGRIYWRGSHYDRLRTVVDDIIREGGPV